MPYSSIVRSMTGPITVLFDISSSVDTINVTLPLVDSCSNAAELFFTGVLAAEICEAKVSSRLWVMMVSSPLAVCVSVVLTSAIFSV